MSHHHWSEGHRWPLGIGWPGQMSAWDWPGTPEPLPGRGLSAFGTPRARAQPPRPGWLWALQLSRTPATSPQRGLVPHRCPQACGSSSGHPRPGQAPSPGTWTQPRGARQRRPGQAQTQTPRATEAPRSHQPHRSLYWGTRSSKTCYRCSPRGLGSGESPPGMPTASGP